MAWTNPMTWPAGLYVLASHMNTHIRDNLNALRGGGIAISGQDTNDFVFASGPDQFGRLPISGSFSPGGGLVPVYTGTNWQLYTPLPIGSIYENVSDSTNPATLLGYGTWQRLGNGQVLVGQDPLQTEFDTAFESGGEKTHTLTTAEMPSHTHPIPAGTSGSGSAFDNVPTRANAGPVTSLPTGGGGAHNNLQPYIVVYRWYRTA